MKAFAADLHIHTALSPCASDEMTPVEIVRDAIHEGLDMIAICDHNSAGNVTAVQQAAGGAISVLGGIEITTAEEAHVIGLFPDASAAGAASEEIGAGLPRLRQDPGKFGTQLLMNASGRVVGTEARMLGVASVFGLDDAVELIRRHDGLAVAAHLDRPSFSVLSQLGMMPADVEFDAIEVSAAGAAAGRVAEFVSFGLPVITSSDSHFPSDVGSCRTRFDMLSATFGELVLALEGAAGRRWHRA